MNIKLKITLKECEGALLRLLGTIERRGHRLISLNSWQAESQGSSRSLALDLACDDRSPDVLLRQIRRLYDVLSAEWYQSPQLEANGARLTYEATLPAVYGMVVQREQSESGESTGGAVREGVAHG